MDVLPPCCTHAVVCLQDSSFVFSKSNLISVYLFWCLFGFVWTWTCFLKTHACLECCWIIGGYNSWKSSGCLPVGFTYINVENAQSCSHRISSTLSFSSSSNQLSQTLALASCPSVGRVWTRLFLSVISHEPNTLCSLPVSAAWEAVLERKRLARQKETKRDEVDGVNKKENNKEQRFIFQLSWDTSQHRCVWWDAANSERC